ncbi:MAG: hypothetical protein K6B64_03205 [Acholeplasmatales bacterium]|nr:hypothetical protein [Acholeplasmatales bacterium]
MNNNEEFLAEYKKLESILDGLYPKKPQDSPIWVYERELKKSNDLEKKRRAEKYSIIRQVRNILSHDEIDDEAPFIVQEETIDFVVGEIKLLEAQKTALDLCVPFEKLVFATKNSLVWNVCQAMLEKCVTNIPILNEKKCVGMFNGKAFIHMIKDRKGINITPQTKLKDIKQYLYLDMNDGVRYVFVKESAKLDQLSQLFKRTKQGKTELLIVTKTGDKFEPILGVISPHDILERG